ncbi:unnamed protein product [Clonostachys rosea f. rosea IK726]|uniref:R3H-associated N-terminal domain-containing protein n=2 Tax=Bionectria ochroleuca TaxID=29856 RepID=A0A0B7JIE1_BIOOC|nr:unnamed protein product [Clonostachys rosea f. rosea IK726]
MQRDRWLTRHLLSAADRLMHVPNAQPPEPRDWEVRATHTVHHIPYQLAQFWDVGVSHETVDSGMVFDSFGEGEGAAYKRWLTHAICDYYGLESKSVTLANPSRRVVYVGIKEGQRRHGSHLKHFPRPMWELC